MQGKVYQFSHERSMTGKLGHTRLQRKKGGVKRVCRAEKVRGEGGRECNWGGNRGFFSNIH